MLVYVRESDKDNIICNVDETDIAVHLRVRCCNYTDSIGSFAIVGMFEALSFSSSLAKMASSKISLVSI